MSEENREIDEGMDSGGADEEEDPGGLLARIKMLIGGHRKTAEKPRRVHIIINPAAGKDQPILKVLNAACQAAGVDWEVFVTKEAGDARRLAREAARKGVDLVVVHGGDGTVMEAASGLSGSATALAILPGGTANIMALELGLPNGLPEACALSLDPEANIRRVDLGRVKGQAGEHFFILRCSTGLEAAMVEGADRTQKDRLGVFAYALSALQALSNPPAARYLLTLDGETVETEGLSCVVANSGAMGTIGMPTLYLAPDIAVSDGWLDVLVITRADLPSLLSLLTSVVTGSENTTALQRWRAREITITAEPPQTVQIDGEILEKTPIEIGLLPGAVRMIVPPESIS